MDELIEQQNRETELFNQGYYDACDGKPISTDGSIHETYIRGYDAGKEQKEWDEDKIIQ